MRLYQIKQEMQMLLEDAELEAAIHEGVVSDYLIDKIEALELVEEEKVLNVGKMIKNLTAEADAIKREEDNLKARRKSREGTIKSLKEFLAAWIPGKNYEDSKCKVSWRVSKKIAVQDETKIPYRFYNEVKTVSLDKKFLKETILGGEEVEGAKVIENNNIQIK